MKHNKHIKLSIHRTKKRRKDEQEDGDSMVDHAT